MTDKYMILHGDSLQELKKLGDSSIDSVVTDPPYGLSKEPKIEEVLTKWLAGEDYDHGHGGFMGKTWDSFVPHPDLWREVYRVLKPGGHALVFAGTRTQDLMTISLRLAGFVVRDVIEWIYFSGFPKSHDVGKAFDRRASSEEWSSRKELAHHIKKKREYKGMSINEMNEYFGYVAGCTWWESINESTNRVPNLNDWEKLKTDFGCSEKFDWLILLHNKGAQGKKIGERVRGTAGFSNEQVPRPWKEKIGEKYDLTAPATDLAKQWDGWGTAIKPSHEPIIVVRKPLEGTVADNVEKYGTGAININACRIGDGSDRASGGLAKEEHYVNSHTVTPTTKDQVSRPTGGRFPANCITLDSDQFYSKYFNITPQELSKKASKSDRNSDWKGDEIDLEEQVTTDGRKKPIDNAFNRGTTSRKNSHPTVKPLDLMAWLVRLVTPPEGIVLDPFAGSGSTLTAAKREGFGFIGVELTDEYIPIIEARTGESVSEVEKEEALM